MDWCAQATKMGVRTNADTPEQVKTAVAFGATSVRVGSAIFGSR